MISDFGSGKIEYFNNGTFTQIAANFHKKRIWHLKYLPYKNGYMASASQDYTVNVWNTLTWISIRNYSNHTSVVYSVDQIDNDTMVSGSYDQTIRIWKISTGETLKIINANGAVFVVRVFSIEYKQIVCGLNDNTNNIQIYNYNTGAIYG